MDDETYDNVMLPQARKRLLIGCTGSVATVKLPMMVDQLLASLNVDVQVVTTENGLHFFDPSVMSVRVFRDVDEWASWQKLQDPVLHIELRKWADLMVICPLDANTLAKIANGLCDNLLTCIVRAWDFRKPLLYAPAMNTFMWEHPITAKHRQSLSELNFLEIPCVVKRLACGDTGYGAMAEVQTIVQAVINILEPDTSETL